MKDNWVNFPFYFPIFFMFSLLSTYYFYTSGKTWEKNNNFLNLFGLRIFQKSNNQVSPASFTGYDTWFLQLWFPNLGLINKHDLSVISQLLLSMSPY